MVYQRVMNLPKNFKVYQKNRLSPRTFFIPFESREQCDRAGILDAIEKSGKVLSLNGLWDFAFYEKGKIPSKIYTQKIKFIKINVPSCWQAEGYGKPLYLKEKYPFNCKPPAIPFKKPVGIYYDGKSRENIKVFDEYNHAAIYRKTFEIEDRDKNFIISFLGVSSAFELYLNGEFVGYSEGSHNTAEFDLTNKIWMGKNEILVVVYRWCNGSYLESHDMFEKSGIFRDVLLFVHEKSYIHNFDYSTQPIEDGRFRFESCIEVKNFENLKLRVVLEDNKDIKYQKELDIQDEKTLVVFEDSFKLYSAEEPYLYSLYISLIKNDREIECVSKKVGFRHVEIQAKRLLYNGKPIVIKGVNYIESHPETLKSKTFDLFKKDLEFIKQYNLNAIQFVYPPHPIMLDLCDEIGLYVISHADINTSGTKFSPFYRPNLISGDTKWFEHIKDRIERMVLSQKSNVSVTIWSMSSQMGNGECQHLAYDYIKELSSLPVQYELQGKPRCKCDIYVLKDPEITELKSYIEKSDKPIVISSFNSSIGNSCGGLKEYMDIFLNEDKLIGGCVWQFYDNAPINIRKNVKDITLNSDFYLSYSGYFNIQRQPYPSALSLKHCFRPLRARLIDDDTLEIFNTNSFRDSSYVDIKLRVTEDGKVRSVVPLKTSIKPWEKRCYDIFIGHKDGDIFLNIDYFDKDNFLIASEQLEVNSQIDELRIPAVGKLEIKESEEKLDIKFKGGEIVFDKNRGFVLNYTVNGVDFLVTSPFRSNFTNLYTDITRPSNENSKYNPKPINIVQKNFSYKLERDFNNNIKKAEIAISNALYIKNKEAFLSNDIYMVYPNGRVDVFVSLQKLKDVKFDLKRFGKTVKMPSEFQNVIYYGRGPVENYADIKEHAPIDIYTNRVSELNSKYPKPQLSGNRSDTRYAMLINDKGEGLMFYAIASPFNFSVSEYSDIAITKAETYDDLPTSSYLYVHIDAELEGVGSFGKGVMEKYKISKEKAYAFGFSMLPYKK
ncbi:MAG: glycoside hydrolase family 2 TIM barrel-domain containing protein [Bacillota bacterium]|jgi:beta-galactosidase|nr:glycoside hydrolase family 2 TIM barrel-domain containing protein [Bacillota bacterium]HHU42988.1 hypothetical protein [Clostridiales bacterium]